LVVNAADIIGTLHQRGTMRAAATFKGESDAHVGLRGSRHKLIAPEL
jgi:hypothetical protein